MSVLLRGWDSPANFFQNTFEPLEHRGHRENEQFRWFFAVLYVSEWLLFLLFDC